MDSEYRHYHRGSIFGPLVLIAIGVIFLLHNRVPGFDVYHFLAHYWPVLLIVWGLVRLVEHYSDPGAGGIGGGEVALLVVIIIFGLALTASLSLGFGHWNWSGDWQGGPPWDQTYQFQTSAQAALPPGLPVVIRAGRASVQLIATPGGQIRARLNDSVRSGSFDRAQSRFQDAAPVMAEHNGQWLVQPAGPDPSPRLRATMRLYLPATTPVTIEVAHGNIQAAGWRAPLTLTTGDGAITVTGAQAAVRIHGQADAIAVHDATALVAITGGGGLTLSDIHGPVRLNGPFSGGISLARLSAGFELQSPRTQILCAALPGSLNLFASGLTASGVRDLQVQTRHRDLSIQAFQGSLRLADSGGAVAASAAPGAHPGPVRIQVRGGDIALGWPRGLGFQLDAQAHDGNITGAWGLPLTRRGGDVLAQGPVAGGGALIYLRAQDGVISRITSPAQ